MALPSRNLTVKRLVAGLSCWTQCHCYERLAFIERFQMTLLAHTLVPTLTAPPHLIVTVEDGHNISSSNPP
jgi:hypothetical protein